VRIGDHLNVERDGEHWWASTSDGRVGRLTWHRNDESRATWLDYDIRYPELGLLRVQRLLLSDAGAVVNLSGYVVPSHQP
jgi:hypothetical protein